MKEGEKSSKSFYCKQLSISQRKFKEEDDRKLKEFMERKENYKKSIQEQIEQKNILKEKVMNDYERSINKTYLNYFSNKVS